MTQNAIASRRDLETQLIEKAWKDPGFKQQVMADPKGMLERNTGQKLPPDLKIHIHEEDANTLHFILSPAPSNVAELSDEELERVAGGTELVILSAALVSAAATVTVSVGANEATGGKLW